MPSIRISKGLQARILELVLKDTKYKNIAEISDFTKDIPLKELLFDIAGGMDKYHSMSMDLRRALIELSSSVNPLFLTGGSSPKNIFLRKTQPKERVTIYVHGNRQSMFSTLKKSAVYLDVEDPIETPYAPHSIFLSELDKDVAEKWRNKLSSALDKMEEYKSNRARFILATNNLLSENNTTAKLKKNCPELEKYLKLALAVEAGVSVEKAKEGTDKSDLKVVLSELS